MPDIFEQNGMRPWPAHMLREFAKKHQFGGARVLEIGSDWYLTTARAMRGLGAAEVVCANPQFNGRELEDGVIKLFGGGFEDLKYTEGYFDIIFGVAVLEHIRDIPALVAACKWLCGERGHVFLQGCPMFTASDGHHVWLKTPNKFYRFCDNTNPFLPWEHLAYATPEEALRGLAARGNPDAGALGNWIFGNCEISLIPPSVVVEAFESSFSSLEVKRYPSPEDHNEYFERATERFSAEDLATRDLHIYVPQTGK